MAYATADARPHGRDSCNRVVLWVPRGGENAARETMADLLQRTAAPSELLVFTEGEADAKLKREIDAAGFLTIPDHDDDKAFTSALGRFHEEGFFFVRAGVRLPEAWDLRLLWTAARHDGAGVVTPLTIGGIPPGIKSHAAFDQLCYLHSSMESRSCVPVFDCAYITPTAARAVFQKWQGTAPAAGFESFEQILSAFRFRSLIADHVGVAHADGARPARQESQGRQTHASIANLISREMSGTAKDDFSIRSLLAPRCLHVVHGWGGGSDRWVETYCGADPLGKNFVLKSIHTAETFASQLWLYRDGRDSHPVRRYLLDPQINGTALRHESYSKILATILEEFGIESIIVSSLIGHSLDALRVALPTVMVCHDYYPFCPALNITFNSVCRSCNQEELMACTEHNPHHRFFRQVPAPHWLQIRKAFAETILERNIQMFAPSKSVLCHYHELQPELQPVLRVVPHGSRRLPGLVRRPPQAGQSRRLKLMVLGSLSLNKGREIVRNIAGDLQEFADLFLVGTGADGRAFASDNRITVIERYEWENLPELIAKIDPDLALLPSVVPETFSYTLQELLELGIPVLATRLGSFNDRITDGVTGFLCDPSGPAMLERIRHLNSNRGELVRVRDALGTAAHRSLEDMIGDYRSALRIPSFSSRAYFARDSRNQFLATGRTRCRVFWRTPGGRFQEERHSYTYYPVPAVRQKFEVVIPSAPDVAALRVDPCDRPGIVILHMLKLVDRNGRTIDSWHAAALEDSASLSSNIVGIGDGAEGTVLCALDGQPRLVLPLAKEVRDGLRSGGALAVEISIPGPEDSIGLLQNECAKEDHPPELDTLLEQMVAARQGGEGFETVSLLALQHATRRVNDLEGSWSWRITRPLRLLAGSAPALMRLINRH